MWTRDQRGALALEATKQQPSPVENVWLAVDADGPIFHYAGIPTRYRLPTGEATAMVSVDTMTAPEVPAPRPTWQRRP